MRAAEGQGLSGVLLGAAEWLAAPPWSAGQLTRTSSTRLITIPLPPPPKNITCVLQAVEAPTLSIMVPLLVRGLRHDNTTAIKRKASVIIENMAKLVRVWAGWGWLGLGGLNMWTPCGTGGSSSSSRGWVLSRACA